MAHENHGVLPLAIKSSHKSLLKIAIAAIRGAGSAPLPVQALEMRLLKEGGAHVQGQITESGHLE